MNDYLVTVIGLLIIFILIAISAIFVGVGFDSLNCYYQGEALGVQSSSYGIVQGCIFTLKDGTKVVRENYIVNKTVK